MGEAFRWPAGGNSGKLRRVCLSVGTIPNGDPNSGLYTRTIDVAAALPKVYKQLSVSNFALVPSYIVATANANMGNNSSVFGGMAYDPEAGVLTVQPTRISDNNTFDGGAVVDVYCLYTAKASSPDVLNLFADGVYDQAFGSMSMVLSWGANNAPPSNVLCAVEGGQVHFRGNISNGAGAGYTIGSTGTINLSEYSRLEVAFSALTGIPSAPYPEYNFIALLNALPTTSIKKPAGGVTLQNNAAGYVASLDVSKLSGPCHLYLQAFGQNGNTNGYISSITAFKT